MKDFNNLSYYDKPFNTNKFYSVHQLSDTGINQLISKESYLRSYISKVDPKIKEIYDIKHKISISKHQKELDPIREVKNQNENLDKLQINEHPREEEKYIIIKNREKNVYNPADKVLVDKILKYFRIKDQQQDKQVPNQMKRNTPTSCHNINVKNSEDNTNFKEKLNVNFSTLYKNDEPNLISSFDSKMKKKTNESKQFRLVPINPKIKNLKDLSKNIPNKLGLTSFNIPHLHELKKSNSHSDYRSYNLSNNMHKTLQSNKFRDENKNNNVNSMCVEENEKIKKIISSQANNVYLANTKLPKIALLMNLPKAVLKSTKLINSKNMGERYNPYSFVLNSSKFSSQRNHFGGSFNN